MSVADDGVYGIGALSKMWGVPAPTLRSWEDRYGQVVPASSGVELLDAMPGDGFWRGSSTLVAEPSGSGKTLVALHFTIPSRVCTSQMTIFGGRRHILAALVSI
jgi:hypothetical protein